MIQPQTIQQVDRERIYQWINDLSSPKTRENALLELRFVLCALFELVCSLKWTCCEENRDENKRCFNYLPEALIFRISEIVSIDVLDDMISKV